MFDLRLQDRYDFEQVEYKVRNDELENQADIFTSHGELLLSEDGPVSENIQKPISIHKKKTKNNSSKAKIPKECKNYDVVMDEAEQLYHNKNAQRDEIILGLKFLDKEVKNLDPSKKNLDKYEKNY
jgi:hypothetical protein